VLHTKLLKIHRMGTPFIKEIRFYHLFGVPRSMFATIDVNLHRQRRSLLNPMFSRKGILDLEFVIKEKIDILCRRMREHEVQDKFINCHRAFAALTADIVTEFAYAKCYEYFTLSAHARFWPAADGSSVLSTPNFASRAFDSYDTQHEVFLILKHFPLMAKVMQALPFWVLVRLMPGGGMVLPELLPFMT